jgi:hypothetical protein
VDNNEIKDPIKEIISNKGKKDKIVKTIKEKKLKPIKTEEVKKISAVKKKIVKPIKELKEVKNIKANKIEKTKTDPLTNPLNHNLITNNDNQLGVDAKEEIGYDKNILPMLTTVYESSRYGWLMKLWIKIKLHMVDWSYWISILILFILLWLAYVVTVDEDTQLSSTDSKTRDGSLCTCDNCPSCTLTSKKLWDYKSIFDPIREYKHRSVRKAQIVQSRTTFIPDEPSSTLYENMQAQYPTFFEEGRVKSRRITEIPTEMDEAGLEESDSPVNYISSPPHTPTMVQQTDIPDIIVYSPQHTPEKNDSWSTQESPHTPKKKDQTGSSLSPKGALPYREELIKSVKEYKKRSGYYDNGDDE